MEVELEHGDHQLDDLLSVVREPLLQLPGVADQHLARGGLVLESSSLDAEVLLFSELNKLPIIRLVLNTSQLLIVKNSDLVF